ncbi:endonuclease/exonuclease/phosphatase family protein [Arachidicoccus sp.]|uniref:endonuclease/exonuclease/phosphatase family protein n=1 Tax=Arachidicoccus sp. TaxID=1872624 RepID=UPI003D255590
MKKSFFLFGVLLIFLVAGCKNQQGKRVSSQNQYESDSVLTVVNWNIEWFGATRNGPVDKKLQETNVFKVLKYLHADIYGLCEIVNIASFRDLIKSMGPDYDFAVSDYASGANSTHAHYYASAQKMAFVYNKNVFTNVSTSGFLRDNSAAGHNFSNGRYPYLLRADVTKNGITKNICFFLVHAKSGSDKTSYIRRVNASNELKAALDKDFAQTPLMIFGDLNDELKGSVSSEKESSYQNFIQDDNYVGITLAVQKSGAQSTIDYPTVIDHQIISKQLNKMYVPHSARIRTDITEVVPDFTSGNTSDHYPISSEFLFSK